MGLRVLGLATIAILSFNQNLWAETKSVELKSCMVTAYLKSKSAAKVTDVSDVIFLPVATAGGLKGSNGLTIDRVDHYTLPPSIGNLRGETANGKGMYVGEAPLLDQSSELTIRIVAMVSKSNLITLRAVVDRVDPQGKMSRFSRGLTTTQVPLNSMYPQTLKIGLTLFRNDNSAATHWIFDSATVNCELVAN